MVLPHIDFTLSILKKKTPIFMVSHEMEVIFIQRFKYSGDFIPMQQAFFIFSRMQSQSQRVPYQAKAYQNVVHFLAMLKTQLEQGSPFHPLIHHSK